VFPPAIPNSDHLRLLKALRFELHYTLPKYMHIRTLKYASDMYPSTMYSVGKSTTRGDFRNKATIMPQLSTRLRSRYFLLFWSFWCSYNSNNNRMNMSLLLVVVVISSTLFSTFRPSQMSIGTYFPSSTCFDGSHISFYERGQDTCILHETQRFPGE